LIAFFKKGIQYGQLVITHFLFKAAIMENLLNMFLNVRSSDLEI